MSHRIRPEKFALRFLTIGMAITVGIFALALPIIILFPGGIQQEISITKGFSDISLSLLPSIGIILVLIIPLGRVMGTTIIFFNSEKHYAAAGFLVATLLFSLMVLSL